MYVHGNSPLSPVVLDGHGPMDSINLNERNTSVTVGRGGLAGRTISVGDGQQRGEASRTAEKTANLFKKAGLVTGAIVAAPVAGPLLLAAKAISLIPRLVNQHILEPRAERTYRLANAVALNALAQPGANSILERGDVMARLRAHADATGRSALADADIRELVATGEHIARGLADHPIDPSTKVLKLDIGGVTHDVKASVHMARAVGWFMMARAAGQDVSRAGSGDASGTSDMVTSGSFVMKDPGNRMYDFLNSAPTAAARMSTHFEERIGHQEVFNFGITTKTKQRGIEDYQSRMPGAGGTMLFDKLRPDQRGTEELFVKFESVGCPPYFQSEPQHGIGAKFARMFAALDRNIGHATNFLHSVTGKGPNGAGVVSRQEHVYKGALKNTVNREFKELVSAAIRAGVVNADASAVGKSVHKLGLPYVEDATSAIREAAAKLGNAEIRAQCNAVMDTIQAESRRLGLASDVHGIERRGAEVHISIL
ncbi:MAG TPA: hypothetical protein VFE82_18625 [Ramlibacter sp.]|jgi:hypothetical protein|uniref:hypothetical protein n=1 Tax=Ramlibacter sp. TaxID=1917967 RepID=UPI002D2E5FD6|nr:hypothetical protein [Ramlibacter sp.]HZY20491.1 hypothetical protein [Ramlibacter sp.]